MLIRRILAVAISGVIVGLAGGVTLADDKHAPASRGKPKTELQQVLDALQRIETRLEALERAVARGGSAEPSKAAALPDPPAGKVTVKATWEYRDFHGKIQTYEAPPGAKLWETKVYKAGEKIPLGAPIEDDVLFLEPGRPKLTVIVYRNEMPKEQVFYVIPHVADPSSRTPDLDFKCACTGERYKVPAGATWARVIEYKVSPKVKSGEKLYTWMVAVGEH
jgi:hypothetical protein